MGSALSALQLCAADLPLRLQSRDQLAGIPYARALAAAAAAAQVAYADFGVLSEVLLEMRQMLATCLQLDSQVSAASTGCAVPSCHAMTGLNMYAHAGHAVLSLLPQSWL
jgi:hypothetical protein